MNTVAHDAEASKNQGPTDALKEKGSITRRLSKPISSGDRTITEITIPHPDNVDSGPVLEAMEGDHPSRVIAVLAGVCGEPYALIRKVKMPDMIFFRPYLNQMMGNGL